MNQVEKDFLAKQESKDRMNQEEKNYFLFQEICHGKTFNEAQKQEIRSGIEDGFTKEQIDFFARPHLSHVEMRAIKRGIRCGLKPKELMEMASVSMSLSLAVVHSVQAQMNVVLKEAGITSENQMDKEVSENVQKQLYNISDVITLNVENAIQKHLNEFQKEMLESKTGSSKSVDSLIAKAQKTVDENKGMGEKHKIEKDGLSF